MPKIFVSYRRDDTVAFTGRLVENLRREYGPDAVYLDLDADAVGVDFRDHFTKALRRCDLALVVIGQRWLGGAGQANRMLDSADHARAEVEISLKRRIPVIPILVGGTRMPSEGDLPADIQPLRFRTAVTVDDARDFEPHVRRLVSLIDGLPMRRRGAGSRSPGRHSAPRDAVEETGSEPPAETHEEQPSPVPAILSAVDATVSPSFTLSANLNPISLRPWQGLAVVGFILALNSILAALGSMLWGQIYYWPAFMMTALACANFRLWGILVAIVTPIISSLMLIGGGPWYIYSFISTFQALIVILVFQLLRIDPGLTTLSDKLKYLVAGAAFPSLCGGLIAWQLRNWAGIGEADGRPVDYAFWWAVENVTPAIFPGIWLHGVVGSIRRPFAWDREHYWTGWAGQTLEGAGPWIATIFISVAMTLLLVARQIGGGDLSPEVWSRIHEVTATSPEMRWLVFAMCVMMLVAVGFSLRQARRAWYLDQAVRRQMPSREQIDLILSGRASPSGQKLVSLAVVRLANVYETSQTMRASVLIDWLNAYFACLAGAATRTGGYIDHPEPGRTLVVFGLEGQENHGGSALLFAVDALMALNQLGARLSADALPNFEVAVGVHTGTVVAGTIGTGERRHYTVVGDAVELADQVAQSVELRRGRRLSVSITSNCVRGAGLSGQPPAKAGLVEGRRLPLQNRDSVQLFAIDDPNLLSQSLLLSAHQAVRL